MTLCPHCHQPMPEQQRRERVVTRDALYRLLRRLGLKGPPGNMDVLATVIAAASAPAAVLVKFDEAETIGHQLHDRFEKMAGKAPLEREDMAWADLVQFVLRTARDVVDQRPHG